MTSPTPAILRIRRPGWCVWLDTSHPLAATLRERIGEIVSIPPSFTPIPTLNRMSKIWEGPLDGLPGSFIIKQGWNNPVYPIDRRIARAVNLASKNRFLRSMEIAARLEAIGFKTVRPVLCWKKGPRLFPSETGILYPKIEAADSLIRYSPLGNGGFDLVLPPPTARALGTLLRDLHDAGFLHMDPAPQNILLRPGAADPPTAADMAFIDIDAFRPLTSPPGTRRNTVARVLSLHRLLCRLHSDDDLRLLCEGYSRSSSPTPWLSLFRFLHPHHTLRPLHPLLTLRLFRLAR